MNRILSRSRSIANFGVNAPKIIPTRTNQSQIGVEQFIFNNILEGAEFSGGSGRRWLICDLRRKSYKELTQLWMVLYKERNRLGTHTALCKSLSARPYNTPRYVKVKKAMGSIKRVLYERHALARSMAREEFMRNKALGKYKWPPETQEEAKAILKEWEMEEDLPEIEEEDIMPRKIYKQ
ncbi:ribosomal protein mL4 [Acrasis kona]|uniref:Large ribosomal subunit protein uL29m n=1 Tax=Acrasis kona TaxID=1008807 RepID=A0AAW2YY65_9EUKA